MDAKRQCSTGYYGMDTRTSPVKAHYFRILGQSVNGFSEFGASTLLPLLQEHWSYLGGSNRACQTRISLWISLRRGHLG